MKNIELLKVWEKGEKKRAYLNNKAVATAIGMTYRAYKSGSVAEAYIDGEKISNNKAFKILLRFSDQYYDMVNDKWSFNENAEYADRIMNFFNNEE